ncbi:Hydantoinase B/oxoprolinase-domain-containing protein [Desarmillaria tabescens]|uniref:Hydantoinase B/oxoprolinase-domain-containing protein n=1 Tax=Armillaria tabescens TaxID=1929756 RepID=A0AA39KAN7_ARMTA|nr:Hydantoinase B/oxoprolinase-domain-containing protein [Desarmillaria tabescens]KAK0457672.1 Hydantoinase B/oxoprolinase-domain-containing protein [Desarmillaria tabescens]
MSSSQVRIAIDRGGTFTDVHCSQAGKPDIVLKLLSVDPSNYPDAPTEGIRRVLELSSGQSIPKGTKLKLDQVESIRMGTTVATNALLERKGARCALVTTEGYRDVLRIGQQARPNIFDLSIRKLSSLYEKVVEIGERVTIATSTEDPESSALDFEGTSDASIVRGLTGDFIRVLKKPDPQSVRAQLQSLHDEGFQSIAIAFVHSYTYPAHETMVADMAREFGFSVSVSSELQPMIKIVSRANSAIADAYLSPVTRAYIETFAGGFDGGLDALGNKLLFMQSDGGLCNWKNFSGLRAVLSGPAGGVIGYSKTCYDTNDGTPLVSVDMGGTSTDVSRYSGHLEHVFETTTAQVIIQAPQLDINTVAAGGGSRLFWENGMFVVGPESAGAHPGPACYRKGGPLAVTDANLLLGRLLPEHFPKIFGPNEDEPLDMNATRKLFEELTERMSADKNIKMTFEEVASGFLRVANEAMSRPIRTLTEARGYESANHNLVIFGGAGGQHGTAIATLLGISRILVARFSSILSAYGMALADVVVEEQEPSSSILDSRSGADNTAVYASLRTRAETLIQRARDSLASQGFAQSQVTTEVSYNCRFQGTSTALMVREPEDGDFVGNFVKQHDQLFGFTLQDRVIYVDDVRVRAVAKSTGTEQQSPYEELEHCTLKEATVVLGNCKRKKVYFDGLGWTDTAVVPLEDLSPGDQIPAPAIIFDNTQTILIEPGYIATATSKHIIIDKIGPSLAKPVLDYNHVDPIQLSVFGHRFMGIAEQMGTILRQTSISTNIKERLDYSCALFSPEGLLVANAPHIPCHLGAMSSAVRFQAELHKGQLQEGDVLVSNHPDAGGSHLPDITVITPAFHNGNVVFWTASRAHHADIGGIRAGSMPPFSKTIEQEGAQILSFKLVKQGRFDEEGVVDLMYNQPSKYPGCSGTRTLSDNISDLKAQVSANYRGATLIRALIEEFSLEVVQFYMTAIQNTAEAAVRELLRFVDKKFGGKPLEAVDYMDDGEELRLKINIDPKRGEAIFDFTGTSPQSYSNLNAPTAIGYSAIIYVLRSLIPTAIPLNHGCLAPIKVIIPPRTILSPGPGAATVAGNVETSQRITDVVLKAFEACGASQGTCNNLTFGYGGNSGSSVTKGFGYYETIAGGSGGGSNWDGQSGIHVHMTDTCIGDAEQIERKYPVIVREFSIRTGSGGAGRHPGGDGCVREIEFTRDLDVAILSERRAIPPYGMRGGSPGERGRNFWLRKEADGSVTTIALGGKNECPMKAGDRIRIETPGGGGYGVPGSAEEDASQVYGAFTMDVPAHANGSLAQMQETANSN